MQIICNQSECTIRKNILFSSSGFLSNTYLMKYSEIAKMCEHICALCTQCLVTNRNEFLGCHSFSTECIYGWNCFYRFDWTMNVNIIYWVFEWNTREKKNKIKNDAAKRKIRQRDVDGSSSFTTEPLRHDYVALSGTLSGSGLFLRSARLAHVSFVSGILTLENYSFISRDENKTKKMFGKKVVAWSLHGC